MFYKLKFVVVVLKFISCLLLMRNKKCGTCPLPIECIEVMFKTQIDHLKSNLKWTA